MVARQSVCHVDNGKLKIMGQSGQASARDSSGWQAQLDFSEQRWSHQEQETQVQWGIILRLYPCLLGTPHEVDL